MLWNCLPMELSYLSLTEPSLAAIVTMALIAKSTGMTWEYISELHNMDRITPFPAAAIKPTGPFRLSTQPGTGSSHDGVTKTKYFRLILINYNLIIITMAIEFTHTHTSKNIHSYYFMLIRDLYSCKYKAIQNNCFVDLFLKSESTFLQSVSISQTLY